MYTCRGSSPMCRRASWEPWENGWGTCCSSCLMGRELAADRPGPAAKVRAVITVQTAGGNTFYLVIDYDKPVDEEGEQYETYFLSMVDEADLLAAVEAAGVEQAACSCQKKCAVGAVNMDCPVCSLNMTECAGVEPELAETVETEEPAPEEAEPETGGNMGMLLLVLAVAVIGGGAGWYFKIYRPKHQKAAEPEEDYGGELEDYDGAEPYGDEEEDGPPWDEDDADGEEETNHLNE